MRWMQSRRININKALFILMGVSVSMTGRADSCAGPPPDLGEPYTTLTGLPARELQVALDEYAFQRTWSRHAQALSAGFAEGDRVYGETLKRGRNFDAQRQAQWRRAYEKQGHTEYLEHIGARLNMAALKAPVVDWILRSCIRPRLWSTASSTGACRAGVAFGLAGLEARNAHVVPRSFRVTGGRCESWPGGELTVQGTTVECVRSGNSELKVELQTNDAGRLEQQIPPPRQPDAGPEPRQETRLSEPVSEAISLHRALDYHLIRVGAGCPSCGLYAADVRPSHADALIVSVATVSSRGSGWRRCPADLRCGVQEFSPPDNPSLSGCSDVPVCRVWRLAESNVEGADVVQITYHHPEQVCVNCGEETDFNAAFSRWQKAAEAARTRCDVVPEAAPQLFATRRALARPATPNPPKTH